MALHGSASANLSPILFKGNNRSLGVNVIIHQDESGSMNDVIRFYNDGIFIRELQDALLAEKIGDDIDAYPNLYAYSGVYSRNPLTGPFTITNPNGSLNISQTFIRGESTGAATVAKWTGSNYFTNSTTHVVNICTNVIGNTIAGRLSGYGNELGGGSPKSEDVHGNLWSFWTTPNAISTGIPGRFGSIIGSNVRKGSTTIIITNSDEQGASPVNMINQLVDVGLPSGEYIPGLSARRYSGYFGINQVPSPLSDNVNYADNLTSIEGPIYRTEFNRFFAGTDATYNNTTWVITGYFLAPTSGVYTFYTNSDDASYLWIGVSAISGYTRDNALVSNGGTHVLRESAGSINLTAGQYYPIRVIYGNQNFIADVHPTELTISFSGPNIPKRTDGTGYFFNGDQLFTKRSINGPTGEMVFRGYRVIALSSYSISGQIIEGVAPQPTTITNTTPTRGRATVTTVATATNTVYDGVLFYGFTSPNPYGYVTFKQDPTTGISTHTISKSASPPVLQFAQQHDTFTLASETRGALFVIRRVFSTRVDNRIAFSKCLAEFIADTV